jgi:hypothetical protein
LFHCLPRGARLASLDGHRHHAVAASGRNSLLVGIVMSRCKSLRRSEYGPAAGRRPRTGIVAVSPRQGGLRTRCGQGNLWRGQLVPLCDPGWYCSRCSRPASGSILFWFRSGPSTWPLGGTGLFRGAAVELCHHSRPGKEQVARLADAVLHALSDLHNGAQQIAPCLVAPALHRETVPSWRIPPFGERYAA